MARGLKIPEAQKVLILADAVQTSAAVAATRWNVSERVIYTWADEMGGLRVLRTIWQSQHMAAAARISSSVAGELEKRLPKLKAEAVIALSLKVLDTAGWEKGAGAQAEAGATAQAVGQQVVQIYIDNDAIDQQVAQQAMARKLLDDFGDRGSQ